MCQKLNEVSTLIVMYLFFSTLKIGIIDIKNRNTEILIAFLGSKVKWLCHHEIRNLKKNNFMTVVGTAVSHKVSASDWT